MSEAEDRTQAPSERRRQRARDEGQAPLSRELVVAAALGAAVLVMVIGVPALIPGFAVRLRNMFVDLGASPDAALRQGAVAWMSVTGPLAALVILGSSAAVLLQTGFLVHGKALMPDPARLDPRRGLKRVFGPSSAVEGVKAVGKLVLFAWAVWSALGSNVSDLTGELFWSPATLANRVWQIIVHIALLVVATQVGLAVLDAGWTRWRFLQRLRMSREDLRQEAREADGDPHVKQRLRQLRQNRARRRMIAAVAKATVVITNPTHYAVALAYERGGNGAPRVVAKGVDDVAARIREAAERAGVPLVPNPPLARALYLVPLDTEVPAEHFRLVAEVIAYVWRLRGLAPTRQP